MTSGIPGVGRVTHRATDPFAAWWHPPVLLPVAAALAAVDHVASVVARGGAPERPDTDLARSLGADLARAGRVVAEVVAPTRCEPFEGESAGLVLRGDLASLRRVGGAEDAGTGPADDATGDDLPELVVPPQGTRLDHLLVRSPDGAPALADVAGPRAAHVVQWAAEPDHDAGIDAILDVVADAVRHLGGCVRLTGWSQGGWLALIHAALNPGTVAELTLVGTPVTFHPRRTLAGAAARAVDAATAHPVGRAVVDAWLPTVAAVQHATLGRDVWRHLDPVGEAARAIRVLGRVGDDDAYAAGMRALTAFTATAPMSRSQYAWFVENLVVGDRLARGTLEIGGRTVTPAAVTCPVRLVAGSRDRVVPPSQAFATADLLTGAAGGSGAARVTTEVVPRDHLGLFTRE